jgi:hypothetical protein
VTPRWRTLAISLAVAAVLVAPLAFRSISLYAYAFPLFGIGVTYVLQYRSSLSRPWWLTFVAITPLSIIALALDWPFSGHVLWNVLFIGHNLMRIRSRAWNWVLVASLVHLIVLKAAFQTTWDLLGAVLSGALALVVLLVLARLDSRPRVRR